MHHVESEREVITSLDANIQALRAPVTNFRKVSFLPCRCTRFIFWGLLTERQRERETLAMHAKPMDVELLIYERSMGLIYPEDCIPFLVTRRAIRRHCLRSWLLSLMLGVGIKESVHLLSARLLVAQYRSTACTHTQHSSSPATRSTTSPLVSKNFILQEIHELR